MIRPGPTFYPVRWWHKMSERRLAAMMRDSARTLRRRLDKLLCWKESAALVVSPMWTPWLDVLPFGLVVYDCIDDLLVHVPDSAKRPMYARWERDLIARCDGAAVTTPALREYVQEQRADVPIAMLRNGVDVEAFRTRGLGAARPGDVPPQGKPIVGFVGALYEWVDFELICRIADRLGDHQFVFVGPYNSGNQINAVRARKNVAILGTKPHEQVPAYVNAFDACWVPFRSGRIARAANPVKNYEYLALGKPVVSPPLADADSFEGLVRIGHTDDEIVALLCQAAANPCRDADARVAFARKNAWDQRARAYVRFVDSLKDHK